MVPVNDESAMVVDEAATDDGSSGGTPVTVLVAVKDVALPAGVSQVDFDAALAAGGRRDISHPTS